ncbi:MAG: carboxypeptidase-like regulatory domain-containing protein, partial [Dysgonamonadaceae bacterium]|nr:carboxypeptidase-like regulatory domain-containing protein [Dysgonamonadaceae bacterium]
METMKIRFYYILMCIIFLFSVAPMNSFAEGNESHQQAVTVKGVVTENSTAEPLIGVSVAVKGTGIGVATGADGSYTINAPNKDAILTFSYLGYAYQEVKLDGRTTIDISMEEDSQLLDEVVVVAYGTQKKGSMTSSVSTIGAKEIANRPVMNLSSTLAGTASGVQITQGRGTPGDESVSIRVRGTGSFNNSDPLILVDGVV